MAAKYDPKKRGGLSHVSDILNYLFDNEVKAPQVSTEMRIWEHWAKSVGPEIARHASPKGFKNGVLFVETKHPAWATELRFKAPRIRQRLNEALGKELVTEIQFRLGKS